MIRERMHDRLIDGLRATHGERRFTEAWSAGWAGTPEQAVAVVHEIVNDMGERGPSK